MIDTFASVRATHFDLTHTNIDGEKRGFRPAQSASRIKTSLPKLFPGATERQNNIIVRPLSDKMHFVQLDDLDAEGLKRVGDAAFLTLTTSPGNHQAWVKCQSVAALLHIRYTQIGCKTFQSIRICFPRCCSSRLRYLLRRCFWHGSNRGVCAFAVSSS